MTKAKVREIRLAENIYIKKEDVIDKDLLTSLYTYDNGDEFISTIKETDEHYLLPSNSYHKLEWDSVIDERNFEELEYSLEFSGKLRAEQQEAEDKFFSRGRARSGMLQAPCGWGKTFVGCSVIARNNTKTLVLVHTKLLFRQWIEEAQRQIPDIKIGRIGDGLFEVEDVTIGIYKTVHNNLEELRNQFSLIIVDEAHLCPADMFSTTLSGLNAKIKMGISATPKRKDGKHIFLADYFTPYMVVAKDPRQLTTPSVQITKTDFKFSVVDPKRDWTKQISKITANQNYLKLIAEYAIRDIKTGRCPLILGDRIQMLKDLQELIPNSICLIGESGDDVREDVLANAGGKYKAILSTRLFDEGISCHRLDTLYHTCPSNNPVKLEQRIGRIIREHPDKLYPLIRDFWLSGAIVSRQQKNRLAWYESRGYNIL